MAEIKTERIPDSRTLQRRLQKQRRSKIRNKGANSATASRVLTDDFKPQGVAIGSSGNVYIADASHNRVLCLAPDGSMLASWKADFRAVCGVAVGTRCPTSEYVDRLRLVPKLFAFPPGLVPLIASFVCDDCVYVTDKTTNTLYAFTEKGTLLWESSTRVKFDHAWNCAVCRHGNGEFVYVLDGYTNYAGIFTTAGVFLEWYRISPARHLVFTGIAQIAKENALLFAYDYSPLDTEEVMELQLSPRCKIFRGCGLATDPRSGLMYVAGGQDGRIYVHHADGRRYQVWGNNRTGNKSYVNRFVDIRMPTAVAVGPDGTICVADREYRRVMLLSPLCL